MEICRYCDEKFEDHYKYKRHNCRQKTRTELIDTYIGLAAFTMYNKWMSAQKLMTRTKDVFIESKYFNALVRFAEYQKTQQIPYIEKFIEYCVSKRYEPYLWSDYEIYKEYIENHVATLKPMAALSLSLKTLERIADELNVELENIFDHIKPSMILKQSMSYNLSPWLLLNSNKFLQLYRTKFTNEQKNLLSVCIDLNKWRITISSEMETKTKIIHILKQLGIS